MGVLKCCASPTFRVCSGTLEYSSVSHEVRYVGLRSFLLKLARSETVIVEYFESLLRVAVVWQLGNKPATAKCSTLSVKAVLGKIKRPVGCGGHFSLIRVLGKPKKQERACHA